MPARGQHGSKVPASRRAAELYLDEGIAKELACERYGIGHSAFWREVDRLRKERAAGSVG